MNVFVQLSKMVLIGFYAVAILSMIVPAMAELRSIALTITAALLAIHAVEYLVLRARMVRAAPERTDHFLQTLIFGYGHWLPIFKSTSK